MTEKEQLIEAIKEISGAFFPAQREADELTLTARWYFGKTVMESPLFRRDKSHVVSYLAELRKCSRVTIYRELRFFEMFPNIEQAPGVLDFEPVKKFLPENKALSWYIVSNRVLVKSQEETRCRIAISRRVSIVEALDIIKEKKCKIITLHEDTGKRMETLELV